jgi:hypothetical protein
MTKACWMKYSDNAYYKLLVRKGLKKIKDGIDCNVKGIDFYFLESKGLVYKRRTKNIKYDIPDGSPRWSTKFRGSINKYGIKINESYSVKYYLTSKGKNIVKIN